VDCEPLTALAPDHAPEAVQVVALVDAQANVAAVPLETVLGDAVKATVGEGDVTDTVVDWLALPPAPVQVRVKVAFALRAPVDCEPLRDFAPDHAPEAVQEEALAVVQVRVELPPRVTVLGLALSEIEAVGAAVTVTVVDWLALPPAPLQVRV
jgi:hypothetical protein